MPAKSKAQLRAAYAAAKRGEEWGREMVAKTPSAARLPERKKPKPKKRNERG